MSKKQAESQFTSTTAEIGGGYCARKNHIGMY